MRRLWLLLIPAAALAAWVALRNSAPPEVPFVRVARETVVSTLTTNGKAEPVEFSAVRSEAAGAVQTIFVRRGQAVQRGQLLVRLNAAGAGAQLSGAQARIAQSRAELDVVTGGGNAREIAQIDSGLAAARAQLAVAQREAAAVERLAARQAATRAELDVARQAVERQQLEIQSLERRRAALATANDRAAAQARLREAQSGAAAAAVAVRNLEIRSPMAGVLYDFVVQPGAYLNPGDLVGHVGRLQQMRVTVYVDEPELGRVAQGMPVTITWDALPGREWKGTVERTPTQVVTLGTRQVGEVTCIIDNPDLSLIVGTNVNAEIRSSVVANALTIPREALRREEGRTGVLKLEGDRVRWQPVTLGVSSVTRVQITNGLREGDAIALPVDVPLRAGDQVRASVR